jgi:hypothetical protein
MTSAIGAPIIAPHNTKYVQCFTRNIRETAHKITNGRKVRTSAVTNVKAKIARRPIGNMAIVIAIPRIIPRILSERQMATCGAWDAVCGAWTKRSVQIPGRT